MILWANIILYFLTLTDVINIIVLTVANLKNPVFFKLMNMVMKIFNYYVIRFNIQDCLGKIQQSEADHWIMIYFR